jgi:integrase
MAYNLGLMNESVVNHIVRPRKIEKRVDCFLPSEQKKIEQAVVNDRRDKMIGIIICLYTGIRLGELLALEWKDIDFQKGELTINKTCYDSKDDKGNYIRIIDTPKTPSSFRTVPIPKQIVPLLKRVKQRSNSINVIAEGKKVPSVRSYQRSFELLQKKLNVNHHGFHALRHTFATRAIECGMDVKSLSEILGHKNPTVTLNRYVHSLMTQKKIYMNRLGRLYDSDDFCVMD